MKKISALIFALIMILSVAGCSGETEENPGAENFVPERGTVENGIYENTAFGIKFETGENWYFLTDSEIAMAMGVAAEEMFGEGAEITGDNIYDIYCVENETGTTVSINHENLGTIAEFTDENYYLETVMTQLLSTGAQNGVVDAIISEIEVGSKKSPCLYIELNYGGETIYQYLTVKKSGSWMSTVTMASLTMEELDETLAKLSF